MSVDKKNCSLQCKESEFEKTKGFCAACDPTCSKCIKKDDTSSSRCVVCSKQDTHELGTFEVDKCFPIVKEYLKIVNKGKQQGTKISQT